MPLEQPIQCDDCDAAISPNKIHLHSTEDDSDSLTSFSCSFLEVRRRIRRACTTKQLKRRLPVLQWICRCTFQSVLYDFLAGFTVALTAIPQGIAYAAVAGLPLEVMLIPTFISSYSSRFINLFYIADCVLVWIVHSVCWSVRLLPFRLRLPNYSWTYSSNGNALFIDIKYYIKKDYTHLFSIRLS